MKKIIFLMLFALVGWQHALAQVPNEPTNLVVTPINTGGMINFTAPSSIGGSSITNYEYSTDGGASWVATNPAIIASPLIISSGLTNCVSYSIKLRAINAVGSGNASVTASLIPSMSADMGINWTSRSSAADNIWESITYGNGLFVAVAQSGSGNRVMTSPDGINWTLRSSAADNAWISVTYGNSLFVAVSRDGLGNRVMTSPNGITWTSRTSAVDNVWQNITYGNGLFVAVATSGTGNRVMTSPDGITWTSRTSAANLSWNSVTYGNGLFVAVANSGTGNRVMTSPNGINWTSRASASDSSLWQGVIYANGLFVAVGENVVMTSPDGIAWTARTAPSNRWYSVIYGNSLFVAVSQSGAVDRVMTSADGITWTRRISTTNSTYTGVTFGNNIFVAVAANGTGNRVMTSSYTAAAYAPVISSSSPRNNAASVVFTQTAPANSPSVSNYEYSTDNGTTWTARSPASSLSPMILSGLTNGTNYNIKIRAINAAGNSCESNMISATPVLGTIAETPNGLVVTPITNGTMIQFAAPANDGGSTITNYEYSTDDGATWVTPSPAIAASPIIIYNGLTNCTTYQIRLRSVNASGSGNASAKASVTPTASSQGLTWTSRTSAVDNNWRSVTYGNGVFVAVSNSGASNRVMTSPDGVTWTSRTSAADNSWNSVTYGNGVFVAVASSGTGNRVMTSPDGITWTSRTSAANNSWNSVTYGNGIFVAVAISGTSNRVMTSPDGTTWTSRTSAADNSWNSVTYGNGVFVAVASSGTNRVMTSPDGITWTSRTSAANISWNSVTYGNGIFVAVAISGTGNRVMTSTDGITWTIQSSVAAISWSSINYGNGVFVTVATSNNVMTGPDGMTWTTITSVANNSWNSVTYGNGVFVAVASSGTGNRVMTSTFSVAVDAPVISSVTFGSDTTVNFSQSSSALAPAISNYEYSTDNGGTWAAVSPATTTSPLTITGLANVPSSIRIRAINSVGSSCVSYNYQNCVPPTSGGTIAAAQSGNAPFNPAVFTSIVPASGETGTLEYKWQSSTSGNSADFSDISSSNADAYDAGALTQTTWFKRLSRVSCQNDWTGAAESNVLKITLRNAWTGATNTIWNDSGNWSTNTVPTASTDIIIAAAVNQPVLATNVAINSLTIDSAATLTVSSAKNLTVADYIANSGTLIVENNANLIQTAVANTNAGSGTATVKRNGSTLFRQDYTLWSSPVAPDQTLKNFSQLTVDPRFYQYNELTDKYNAVNPSATTFATGKGYLIRMPDQYPANSGNGTAYYTGSTSLSYPGIFRGTLNNGNISVTLAKTSALKGYQAVGNPYPSVIDAQTFLTANSTNIENTLYFWRKRNGASGSAYATWTSAGSTSNESGVETPNGKIQVGQGFIVQAKNAGTVANFFTNAMRDAAPSSTQFFKTKQDAQKDRLWLNLTSITGVFSQALVAYIDDATLGLDQYDGKYINDSDIALTTSINNEEYTIQGRPAFDATDVVALNFKTSLAGTYTIAIDHVDGLFSKGQDIYLLDKTTGVSTNLNEGPYTFAAQAGVDNTRFTLTYQKTLKVEALEFNENTISVLKNNGVVTVNSTSKTIKTIQVYDVQGRLVAQQKNVNATKASFNNLKTASQVLIVKVIADDNAVVSKKVIN